MPSPQLNLRIALEHHALLKAVAAHLRNDAAFANQLAALLAGLAAPIAPPVADASSLASIMARLEALERRMVAEAAGEALEVDAQRPLKAPEPIPIAAPVKTVPPPVPSDSLPPGNWSEEEAAALRSIRLGWSGDVPQEPATAPARRGRSRKPVAKRQPGEAS
jgi:hypothetical protein